MAEDLRVERGWIIVNGTRQDDGSIRMGSGELRLSPFDALGERKTAPISTGAIVRASVQRLAFWRR